MRFLYTLLWIFVSQPLWADPLSLDGLQLAKPAINRTDVASIKRGAKVFATTCITCHTMRYLKYDKLAQEAGITYDRMPLTIKTWPYGVTPPDLSLTASVRGIDWIYTYLHSFYTDPSRPTGANNLLVHNTAMPAILTPFQGMQTLVSHPMPDLLGHLEWYDFLAQTTEGSIPPAQFDAMAADITNFLAYAAEPYYAEQHRIGRWVLVFLCVFFGLMYLLKREYWKDVKKNRKP